MPENIQIIDINEAEILAESKKVAEKHFTDEVMCNPAPSKYNSSTLSKRKHQITYLAFQVSNIPNNFLHIFQRNTLVNV